MVPEEGSAAFEVGQRADAVTLSSYPPLVVVKLLFFQPVLC